MSLQILASACYITLQPKLSDTCKNLLRHTIHKLMTRYGHTDTVRDRQRPGRPRATTARTGRLTQLRQCFLPATFIVRRYGLSAQTIRIGLRKNKNPIRARRP